MKYIRTKDGIKIVNIICNDQKHYCDSDWNIVEIGNNKIADTIEKLCDCFIKIKRKRGCKDFILKHDFNYHAQVSKSKNVAVSSLLAELAAPAIMNELGISTVYNSILVILY